ncbi:MAG: DUF3037 domain-containing protein [Solirubrobacterales bacterium]
MTEPSRKPFSYALLRAVPSIERGECINIGVVLFSRQHGFLAMKTGVDPERLAAFAPDLDPAPMAARLDEIADVIDGNGRAGALAELPQSERFGWLVAPSSTAIQPSEVHAGLTDDPAAELQRLFETLVRQVGST